MSDNSDAAISKLSMKEATIIGQLSEGKSYKQIAKVMGVSPRTVEWHVNNALKKTECHNKIEIIQFAKKVGLISDRHRTTKLNAFVNRRLPLFIIVILGINGLCLALLFKLLSVLHVDFHLSCLNSQMKKPLSQEHNIASLESLIRKETQQ